MKWRIWEKHERQDLAKGEIIRQKVNLKDADNSPKDWDGYLYGRVVDGFGMHKDCMGNALFVENESWTYEDCRNGTSNGTARWQRNSKIQILVE